MFIFDNIQKYKESVLLENVVIALINPLHIPVHIAIISKGECFELTVKGVKQSSALALVKSKSPLLLLNIIATEIKISPKEIFNTFSEVDKNTSCIQPIVRFLSENINQEFSNCKIIFDVLEKLIHNKVSFKTYQLHLDKEIKNNSFALSYYTAQDVDNYIQKLKIKLVKQNA